MEEKTSHVFIKEEMREGSEREGADIMRFRKKEGRITEFSLNLLCMFCYFPLFPLIC